MTGVTTEPRAGRDIDYIIRCVLHQPEQKISWNNDYAPTDAQVYFSAFQVSACRCGAEKPDNRGVCALCAIREELAG